MSWTSSHIAHRAAVSLRARRPSHLLGPGALWRAMRAWRSDLESRTPRAREPLPLPAANISCRSVQQPGLSLWGTVASATGSFPREACAASPKGRLEPARRGHLQGSASSSGTSSACWAWLSARTPAYLSLSARAATPSSTNATASSSPSCRGSMSPRRATGSLVQMDLITSSPQCLHGLVGWVHGHAASCRALPHLQRTLSSDYCGVIQAVWGCDQGHDYTMDSSSSCKAFLLDSTLAVKWPWDKETVPWLPQHRGCNPGAAPQTSQGRGTGTPVGSETRTLPSTDMAQPPSDSNPAGPRRGFPPQPSLPLCGAPGQLGEKQVPSSTSDDRVKDEFSDLSEGDFLSEDENDKKQNAQSSDESFEPYPERKVSGKKTESKEAKKSEEPRIRKKPGPKPGWKKKLRCEREELPTIYKCPYQGCTAVYRGADGMKKHIKEHHEEVRERPCPHPGCNKVFMIDRYLQRHVKLIHTEVRNYICDECGQTFKQRKHLLVHQMRHSGAKPLQCEVCGFQCRQRASLKYHMTKHKAETELDFACDQCGRRFEKAHNLNVHMSMVHPLTQTQDKALPLEAEPPPGPPSPSGTTEGQAVKPEPT
uniref:Zinc finger protein 276 n=1 Tax=Callithrix jacchus TaxID=9483 RepID=F6WDI9_CALJA